MIKLLKQDYDRLAEINQVYSLKRQELKAKLDADSDALIRAYGADPETDDLIQFIPEDKYREYVKKNNKLLTKYESDLCALQYALDDDQERYDIINAGIENAMKGKSCKELYEDAKATIYSHAYDEISGEGLNGAYAMFGGMYGSVDLNVEDHLREIRETEPKLADELWDLLERYKAGKITLTEAEPYKDFEYIKIEISLPKGESNRSDAIRINRIVRPTDNVRANADLVQNFFNPDSKNRKDDMLTSILPITTGKGKKAQCRKATVAAYINYDGLQSVTVMNRNQSIALYDRLVYDAIASLYDAGNQCITVKMVVNAMLGYKLKGDPSAAQCEKVLDSIRKLSTTRVLIDTSEIATAYPDIEKVKFEGNALNTNFVTVNYRDKTWETAIKVNEVPIFLRYAQGVNQVVRNDINLLATPIQSTDDNVLLQGYLYGRVLGASGRSNYNIISVDTMLKELGIERDNYDKPVQFRKRKSQIITNAIKILDYWKEENFIAGYQAVTVKKGRSESIVKFEITK